MADVRRVENDKRYFRAPASASMLGEPMKRRDFCPSHACTSPTRHDIGRCKMNTMVKRVALSFAAITLAAALGMSPVAAQQADQQQAIKRTIFSKSDVPGTNYETVFGMAEIAPNTDFASHTHPGTESSYIVEGGITLNVKGQATREVKTGEPIFIPAATPHSGRSGPNGAKIVAAWVVEKGKPLASPAEPFAASAK
jgi:quercetin dioxygenase-like cupin family protein